jgi:surface-anchored protein
VSGSQDEPEELELHYHFAGDAQLNPAPTIPDPEGYVYEPSEAYVRVGDSAVANAPTGGLSFLGLEAGDPLWYLDGNSGAPGLPFIGFAAELDSTEFSAADLMMTDFSGPEGGEFALWTSGLGDTVYFQTSDGIGTNPGDDNLPLTVGGHSHYNMGFTEAGVYSVELTATAKMTAAAGGAVLTDTGTFRFAVGNSTAIPEPGSFAALGLGAVGLLVRRRRKS